MAVQGTGMSDRRKWTKGEALVTQMPPALIFLHIPKAAGTTLHRIIDRQYDPSAVYTIDGARVRDSLDAFKKLPSDIRNRIKIIKGHMSFGLHCHLPQPCTYFTMLRHPVDRVISHYYFVLEHPDHYLHQRVTSNSMTLADYVDAGVSKELDNGQTRSLSGVGGTLPFGSCDSATLEMALENLNRHFSVVGLTERFDESLLLFKRAFGWRNVFYVRQNVGRMRPGIEQVSKEALHAITKHNALDRELYRSAVNRFEDQLREQPSSFSFELWAFSVSNRIYSWRH
jgi:hypothetical protein